MTPEVHTTYDTNQDFYVDTCLSVQGKKSKPNIRWALPSTICLPTYSINVYVINDTFLTRSDTVTSQLVPRDTSGPSLTLSET